MKAKNRRDVNKGSFNLETDPLDLQIFRNTKRNDTLM